MNCAMSSRVMSVSAMEALIPGSRLRSEIDILLGDKAARTGEVLLLLHRLGTVCEEGSMRVEPRGLPILSESSKEPC